MNAEQYLNEALGGNMNISTLKPLAWHEIMEGYARHKIKEAQSASTNSDYATALRVIEDISRTEMVTHATSIVRIIDERLNSAKQNCA